MRLPRLRRRPGSRPPLPSRNVAEEYETFSAMWRWQARGMRLLAARVRVDWPGTDSRTGVAAALTAAADEIEHELEQVPDDDDARRRALPGPHPPEQEQR